ncbi:ergosterol biosynthesis ERG4/ERG24 [Syncephalastrum racemosum]|uniref:Delta(14)-sterol reductase ERG24 n=1 Tax=Syncephalastrum racemosum TaxID=13706 RepID=A0A1X2HB21_SYNRA|nr:ergosterol biosynthesis ERG4/ERG24 [Syncephalastrum racemosum]
MADNTTKQENRPGPSANEQELNPKTQHYEFLGPIGAFGFVTVLPLLVLFFATCCGPSGYPSQDLLNDWRGFLAILTSREHLLTMLDWKAMAVYLAFVAVLAVFANVLSGDVIPGTTLRNGQRLKYRLNAFASFYNIFLLLIALLVQLKLGLSPLTFVYDHWVGLVTASILFSYLVSLAVYIKSFQPGALLALGGNTGNALYDYVIGRELNPRIGEFDIKFFTELRPGLIGWIMLNVCFAVKQYLDLGRVTNAMGLVLFFHTWYVADGLWNEEACLTTMDITSDGFGFMLAFGLYTWVPMTYTLQARYLVDFPRDISYLEFGLIFALNILGYYIFRSANSQKNEFRTNPESPAVKHLKYLKTERGTKLIISSWWGISRHINYLGDWLMALSWCLPCGFGSAVPYFYAIYFAILLIHRERRDDYSCRIKYGKDWDKYCSIVKYRIIPGIY